jgi:hypothetical protein
MDLPVRESDDGGKMPLSSNPIDFTDERVANFALFPITWTLGV